MTDLTACQAMLATLNAGGKVTISHVREALGSERSHWLELELGRVTTERAEAREARSSMRAYVEALRIADLLNSRAENAKSPASGHVLYNKAETRYEDALTILSELLQFDPTLQRHLDRDMDWENLSRRGMVSCDVQAVPRVRYHRRRVFGDIEHQPFRSRDDIMIAALQQAIATPDPMPASEGGQSDEQNDRLKTMLKSLRTV